MKQQFNPQDFGPSTPNESTKKPSNNHVVSPFNPNDRSFRELIKANMPRKKAGQALIQAIKASIKKTED